MRWLVLVVALIFARGAAAQDSLSRWVSWDTLPHVLVWDSLSLNRLSVLTFGMHNEIMTCFVGPVVRDTAFTQDMIVPWHDATEHDQVRAACPRGSLVFWHNHPWTAEDSVGGFPDYRQMCALSRADMMHGASYNVAFVATAVSGRSDTTVLCWWTQEQIRQGLVDYYAQKSPHLSGFDGQRLYLIRPRSFFWNW